MVCEYNDTLNGQLNCIFFYEGNTKDSILNYTVLLLNVLVASTPLATQCTGVSRRHETRTSTSMTNTTVAPASETNNTYLLKRRIFAILALTFVLTFQVVLCLIVKCSGISIIWCAIAGWIFMDCYRQRGQPSHSPIPVQNEEESDSCFTDKGHQLSMGLSMLTVDGIVIVYYAIVAEPITTLAHILAIVVLGIPLHYITEKYSAVASERRSIG
jgi:hypothetical protein